MAQSNKLSKREQEVVKLLLEGKSNKLIASALSISDRTVEFHLRNIYEKSDVSSRTELILKLGNTPAGGETEKPVKSTVAEERKATENRDRTNSPMNWFTSLREAVSNIGKELRMENVEGSDVSDGDNTLTFYESIRVCLAKYAEFNGRASRAEFWWFTLFVTLVASALTYLSESVASVFLIAMLLPLLAVGARRLHDTGRSGWWQLFMLVPVGGIVLVWILCAEPTKDTLPA